MVKENQGVVVIKAYDVAHLAHIDKAKLADEGIDSVIRDENIVSISPYLAHAVGYIKLLVFEKDIARAKEILARNEFDVLTDTFENAVDAQIVCPNCNSVDAVQRKSLLSGILFLLLFFVPSTIPTKQYRCITCGHIWKPSRELPEE